MLKVSRIHQFLNQQGFLVLDGGLATELETCGFNLDTPLWSAHLLQTHPEAIKNIHMNYLEAGADCIVTASYQASFQGFAQQNISELETENLLQKSVSLALAARDEYLKSATQPKATSPFVAASIGPYGAYLANGAEYHGNYNISKSELRDFHEKRFRLLAKSGADFLACETIPSIEEAEVLLTLLEESPDAIAWMSFSCRDGIHINDGTPIRECARLLKDSKQVFAIGVNCTAPRFVSSLINEIKNATPQKLIAVYPNSGEIYDGKNRNWVGIRDAAAFGTAASEWFRDGARLIGGCCRTGPEHVKSIWETLVMEAKKLK